MVGAYSTNPENCPGYCQPYWLISRTKKQLAFKNKGEDLTNDGLAMIQAIFPNFAFSFLNDFTH